MKRERRFQPCRSVQAYEAFMDFGSEKCRHPAQKWLVGR
jgi:hypothetical protein